MVSQKRALFILKSIFNLQKIEIIFLVKKFLALDMILLSHINVNHEGIFKLKQLDLIILNQRVFFNKNGLGYKPNISIKYIFHDRNKSNHLIFKCNFCNQLIHLEPYWTDKLIYLRWSKRNNFRSLIISLEPKKIQVPKVKKIYFA